MASHELRNPLSGVWQNAEVVSGSLERILDVFDDMRNGIALDPATIQDVHNEVQEDIESIESIILCAAHQGRIADGENHYSSSEDSNADELGCRYSQHVAPSYELALN